jgi:hypothetical protein
MQDVQHLRAHEAAKAAEKRQERLIGKQMDDLNRWMKKHPGFDMPGAALSLVIGKLCQRLQSEEGLFDDLPADKAATGLIQAARAAAQHEKVAGDRKKQRAAARAEAVAELREALKREPDLWEQIEALVAKEQ